VSVYSAYIGSALVGVAVLYGIGILGAIGFGGIPLPIAGGLAPLIGGGCLRFGEICMGLSSFSSSSYFGSSTGTSGFSGVDSFGSSTTGSILGVGVPFFSGSTSYSTLASSFSLSSINGEADLTCIGVGARALIGMPPLPIGGIPRPRPIPPIGGTPRPLPTPSDDPGLAGPPLPGGPLADKDPGAPVGRVGAAAFALMYSSEHTSDTFTSPDLILFLASRYLVPRSFSCNAFVMSLYCLVLASLPVTLKS